jgi:hypothetical protein
MQLRRDHRTQHSFLMIAPLSHFQERWRVAVLLALTGLCLGGLSGPAAAAPKRIEFTMVPAQATCLRDASARVTVTSRGPVEVMDVTVEWLPTGDRVRFLCHSVAQGALWFSVVSGRYRDR